MGFEPTTFCLEGRRSTKLSYHRVSLILTVIRASCSMAFRTISPVISIAPVSKPRSQQVLRIASGGPVCGLIAPILAHACGSVDCWSLPTSGVRPGATVNQNQ